MLNNVTMMIRPGADIEIRTTPSGKSVCSFDAACQKPGRDKGSDWFTFVAWDKTAEFLSNNVRKGSLIAIEGRLQAREYTDKQGNKRKAVEIVVDQAHFCESKKAEDKPAPDSFNVVDNGQDFEEVDDSEPDLPF